MPEDTLDDLLGVIEAKCISSASKKQEVKELYNPSDVDFGRV